MIIKMAWEWGQGEEHAPNWLRLLLEVFVGVHTLFHCWKLVTPAGILHCLLVLRHQGSAHTCKYGQPLANEIVPAEAPIYWYVLLWSLLVLLLHAKSSSITPEITTTVRDWLVVMWLPNVRDGLGHNPPYVQLPAQLANQMTQNSNHVTWLVWSLDGQ